MREESLRAIQPKRFVPRTTDSCGTKASPNLLAAINAATGRAGQTIVGDITHLPLRNGKFCYLAVWQDKATRRIIGWKLSDSMTADLVIEALRKAIGRGLIKRGAIVHTDRGSQYASIDFRALLTRHQFQQSMSAKGNCYDNAQAESFFGRFKIELVEGGSFESIEQAQSEVFSYIEGYYNRHRLHSSLGYKTPLEYEAELKKKEQRSKESLVSIFS
jgi:transposase InsO family protein